MSHLADQKEKPAYWDPLIVQDLDIFSNMNDCLVQNDISDAVAFLRNPFPFDVEVVDLQLSTLDEFPVRTEVSFKKASVDSSQSKVPIILKPKSTTRIPLFIIPLATGMLRVEGIIATVCSSKRQIFKTAEKLNVQLIKSKSHSALDSLHQKLPSNPKSKIVELKVLNAQPFLKLLDVNLNNKWITLLEGECKRFNVVLKNTSEVEINNLVSKFADSTIEPLNQLLANKNLPPNEVYEIEYYLLKKKPFKILNKDALQKVIGDSEFTLNMEIWGKRGVKEASLILEYSNSEHGNAVSNSRTMSVPVNVTVYPSVELVGCDFIPLSSNTKLSENTEDSCWSYLRKMVSKGYKLSEFCLLALDFINSWSQEMQVTLQSLLEGSTDPEFQEHNGPIENLPDDAFCSKIVLQPKKNARVLIPIRRMSFDLHYLNQRIPSLRNKQFIFDSKTPEAEKKFINHAFWYRDELMKRLRACWKIMDDPIERSMNANRSGTIDLRSIRFSSRMVEILEVEKVGIVISIFDTNGNPIDQDSIELGEFYSIKIKLVNRNSWPVFGMLRHIPVCRSSSGSLERKVLFNGVLQFGIPDPIESGKSVEFDLGVVFLEKGEYEWGALFDEMEERNGQIPMKQQHLQRQQLKLKVC
ncbi:unnamed protein product [Ambrosiozyma monospora]|uniref:Unnamed protein product n=1 Tax=Ambrosiozyma monospora TaxID=43982 RepID=A0ACB5SXT0_AMBMO|nr:unnamed protein product [Ambrosiozyma monospora]